MCRYLSYETIIIIIKKLKEINKHFKTLCFIGRNEESFATIIVEKYFHQV